MITRDDEAFLAKIEENPLDESPRLIYADWLEEQGRDRDAAYLRNVVELVRNPNEPELNASIVELSANLDSGWRNRCGSRFDCFLIIRFGNMLQIAGIFRFLIRFMLPSDGSPPQNEPEDTVKRYRLKNLAPREEIEILIRMLNGIPFLQRDSTRLEVVASDEESLSIRARGPQPPPFPLIEVNGPSIVAQPPH